MSLTMDAGVGKTWFVLMGIILVSISCSAAHATNSSTTEPISSKLFLVRVDLLDHHSQL